MAEDELGEGPDDGFAGVVVLCYGGAEGVVGSVVGPILDGLLRLFVWLLVFCCGDCCCNIHMRERALETYDELGLLFLRLFFRNSLSLFFSTSADK